MPLEIHEKLEVRILEALEKALPNIQIKNGMFLDASSRIHIWPADNAVPDHGPLRIALLNYVDEFPLLTFVGDVLQQELFDIDRYDGESPQQKLPEIPEFKDTDALAVKLFEQFQSLPWKYTLFLKLPEQLSKVISEVLTKEPRELSASLRLVKPDETLAAQYPINSESEKRQARVHGRGSLLFPEIPQVEWAQEAIYLQIEIDGFIGPYGGTAPYRHAERLLKSFVGLCIALRLMDIDRSHGLSPPTAHFYVHKADAKGWSIESKVELDTELARALSSLAPHEIIAKAESDEKRRGLIELILKEMKAVFSAGTPAEPILLASEWLLDSYTGRDDRLNYVQSIVVLEVLLGNKAFSDEIGLGMLLRNRLAYLIGKNPSDRNALLKDFDEIYKVRSQIVHRGKARLSMKERVLFSSLRDMCNRVIQREVDLLRAEKK